VPWTEVLTCETCPETVPWRPGESRRDIEDRAERRRWKPDRHQRWYCPRCLLAAGSSISPVRGKTQRVPLWWEGK
jgi:hypothetical protein